MEHFVVAEIVRERRRVRGNRLNEVLERDGARGQALRDNPPSRLPGRHQRKQDDADEERQPAALTAIPYAAASTPDDRKPMTIRMVLMASIQLICGT
jgi:hypothetical protein